MVCGDGSAVPLFLSIKALSTITKLVQVEVDQIGSIPWWQDNLQELHSKARKGGSNQSKTINKQVSSDAFIQDIQRPSSQKKTLWLYSMRTHWIRRSVKAEFIWKEELHRYLTRRHAELHRRHRKFTEEHRNSDIRVSKSTAKYHKPQKMKKKRFHQCLWWYKHSWMVLLQHYQIADISL